MQAFLALATNILRQSRFNYLAAVAFTTGALAASAHAARFVDEPFDYLSGSLAGQTGGVGFTGPWVQVEGFEEGSQVEERSLQHSSIETSGNKSFFRFDDLDNSNAVVQRDLTRLEPLDGSVYWVSYLLKEERAAGFGDPSEFLVNLSPIAATEQRVGFGVSVNQKRFVAFGGRSISAQSDAVAATGQTYLLVASITFNLNGFETARLYVDPALDREPTSPVATVTGFELPSIASVQVFSGQSSPQWAFDELRIGDSYFAVVPEPSVSLSLLLGSPLLLGIRRRRIP